MSQTKRMLITLAAILVAALGLGAYAYLGVFQKEKEELAAKEAEEKLFSLDPDAVTELVVRAKGEVTELEKREAGWWVVSPVSAPADASAVEGLLRQLSTAKRTRVVVEEGDPAAYGLAEPSVQVVAKDAAGETATLSIGDQSAFDRSTFLRAGDGRILAGHAGMKTPFEKGTFDLRDKKVVTFGQDTLASLELRGDETASLSRVDGAWTLTSPVQGPADPKEVESLLRSLQDLRATAFPEGGTDLGAPAVTVVLGRIGGEPLEIRAWKTEEATYVRAGEGPLAQVGSDLLDSLRKGPEDLRDRRVAPFETHRVHKVRFSAGDEHFTVVRKGSEWEIVEPEAGPATRWRMSSALSNLAEARADQTLPASAAAANGLEPPSRTVVLFDEEGAVVETFHFGKEEGGHVYLRKQSADAVYRVDGARLGNVPRALADVREPPAEARP